MAGAEKAKETAQGAASSEKQPVLFGAGAGSLEALLVKLSEQYDVIIISNKELMDSNAKLAEQNQSVIDSLNAFKEHSAEFVEKLVEGTKESFGEFNQPIIESTQKVIDAISGFKTSNIGTDELKQADSKPLVLVDPDADYEVAPGQSFADKDDFTKKYYEGEDVTHLGAERLQVLLDLGLIQEA